MTNVNKSVQIPCPKCGRELKLPDRSLLGRKGKCPKCSHMFVLEEPAVVTLELAGPDSVVRPPGMNLEIAPPPAPAFMSKPAVKKEEPAKPVEVEPAIEFATEFPSLEQFSSPSGGGKVKSGLDSRYARNRVIGMIVGAVMLMVGGGLFVFMRPSTTKGTHSGLESMLDEHSNEPNASTAEHSSPSDADVPVEDGVNPSATEYARRGNPTHGKPIDLQYIPFGTQVILNLRPAELWKAASPGEEIRYCAPPIAKLIETTLNDLFKRKPEEVEELLICLIPGTRGTMPDISAVAHMLEEQKRSQLIDQFGQRVDTYEQPMYVTGNRAYLIPDLKTLVVGPKSQAPEIVQAIKERHPAEQFEPLLPLTDRTRHVTVIFTPDTLGLQDAWYPANVQPFVRNALDWLGDEAETVSWSFHLTDEMFYSDLVIRHRGMSAKKYEQEFKGKLARLAEMLVPLIGHMNPTEMGKRMVIGRVPAMVEVFSMATISSHGPKHVQFVTPLPDRAAPNLALGTVLAWDESTRTDFSKVKPAATEGPSKVPELVADRLKMKIDVDFRAAPFNEAFAFISGEIKTPIEIDGDSLKLGGFTKNIKQEFRMDSSPAVDVIVRIFKESKGIDVNPEKNLVLILDESKKRILVTTLAGAGRKGLTPLEIKQ